MNKLNNKVVKVATGMIVVLAAFSFLYFSGIFDKIGNSDVLKLGYIGKYASTGIPNSPGVIAFENTTNNSQYASTTPQNNGNVAMQQNPTVLFDISTQLGFQNNLSPVGIVWLASGAITIFFAIFYLWVYIKNRRIKKAKK